jgi:hypothetical protein
MLHRQKPLTLMNMPWSEVLTEITGVTGQAILRATGATAHKIARVVYHLLKDRGAFQGTSAIEYEMGAARQFLLSSALSAYLVVSRTANGEASAVGAELPVTYDWPPSCRPPLSPCLLHAVVGQQFHQSTFGTILLSSCAT